MELPPAALLFRSARQYVYGVLFSLAETQRKMERLAIRRRLPVEGKYCFNFNSSLKVWCGTKTAVQAHHTCDNGAVFEKMHNSPEYILVWQMH